MKYLQNKPFHVGPSDSAEANKRYADNWDAIFGKKETVQEYATRKVCEITGGATSEDALVAIRKLQVAIGGHIAAQALAADTDEGFFRAGKAEDAE